MVSLNVRLDESERSKLLRACETRGCSMSELVREALRAYILEERENLEPDNSQSNNNKSVYEVKITSDGRTWQRLKGSNIWEQQVRD